MNVGYIYKITNNVNGKVYIGQTNRTIEKRFSEHKHDSNRPQHTSYNCHFYRAIRKYGIENFSVEEVERCDIDNLNEREVFWIDYYGSFHDGYNSTLGGEGTRTLEFNEEEVMEEYRKIKSIEKTAEYFNCSIHPISQILHKNGEKIIYSNINVIYLYNQYGELIKEFHGRKEAGEWLIENNLSKSDNPYYVGTCIKLRFRNKNKFELFGYIWEIERPYDLKKYEIMRKKYREQNKLNGYKAQKIPCPVCGNTMYKSSNVCQFCDNKIRKQKGMAERKEKFGLTRDILKQEIRETSFLQLGEKYGVSDNAVRKWCKKYGLPFKSREIKAYTDEEWEKI